MAYVDPNYRTKKEFLAAVKAGQELRPYNPSGIFPQKQNGDDVVEGPHNPEPHRWYAAVRLVDGVIVSAK